MVGVLSGWSESIDGILVYEDWYSSDALIILHAEDNTSGVSIIQYSTDGINWTTYTEPIPIQNTGELTLYYRSIDIAGNIELMNSITVKTIGVPIELLEFIISELENVNISQEVETIIDKAIKKLEKAIDWFESEDPNKAFIQINRVVILLEEACSLGADIQSIIDALLNLKYII